MDFITIPFILIYLAVGSIAGFLAGLLGVGGGLVIVPALVMIFTAQQYNHEYIQHMALGTSLATIIFTSISSVRSHMQRQNVDFKTAKTITIGTLLGTLIGTYIASLLSSFILKLIFVIFAYYVFLQMILNIKPKASRELPSTIPLVGVGSIVGIFSSFVGIGGATMSVPFMTFCNVPMLRAIGTASAIGFPIAIAGTIGYIWNGLKFADQLPAYTLGFIHLPSLLCIAMTTMFIAPFGAKMAHKMPVDKLKKAFAFLLFILGTKMLISII